MSSQFYFASPSSTSPTSSNASSDDLPFPAPISRSSFSSTNPTFNPTTFLTTSTPAFLSLPDLHAELKALSTTINTELLDLVNTHYEEFLNLGLRLRGGEERVEEVRVGVLGVKRDVEGVRSWVEEKEGLVRAGMEELRGIKRKIAVGRGCVEVERRMGELEGQLGLVQRSKTGEPKERETRRDEQEGDDDEDTFSDDSNSQSPDVGSDESSDEADHATVPIRLKRRVDDFLIIRVLTAKIGPQHPFLVKQAERMVKVRSALLLDLEAAMRGAETDEVRREIVGLRVRMDGDVSTKRQ